MFRLFSKLYDAPDSITPSPGPLSKEDMIDFLSDDVDTGTSETGEKEEGIELEVEAEIEPKDDETEEETSPDEELKEIEEELEPPTEEQLELVTPVRRKEILTKYPNLFKDFPYLEKAYYREQQFTELLPTIEDAKIAVEKSNVLDRFEQDVIVGGNTENILRAVRTENPESFKKLVDNYLPALASVDEQAYYHVLGNTLKHTIISMVKEGKQNNNAALTSAAQILNQFVFGTSNFTSPKNLAAPTPQGENQISEREQKFYTQQLESTIEDLNARVNNSLKHTIDANIDPNKSMTDYVKKNASKDAIEILETLISKDSRFKALTDKLWEKAAQENFSKTSVDKIKSAYLSKAKTLLPSVIKKARNDALQGLGHTDTDSTPKKGPVAPGQPRSNSKSGKITKASDIPRNMKTIDFLMQD